MIKNFYCKILKKIIKKTFLFWQWFGLHITPNHFYEPVPDTRKIKNDFWDKGSQLIGVDMNEKKQLELLDNFVSEFKKEYENFPKNKTLIPHQYYVNNGAFEFMDGEMLYCMIRHFKPKKVIEIGSGFSTYLMVQAISENKKYNEGECELISIDPFPNKVIKKGFSNFSKLIEKEVQDIDFSFFNQLGENDILFIDSSHVLKIGSDVQYELLELLPRVNKGVIIHFHDIFLPAEYPKEWVLNNCLFWTEQYLLQAFLAFNNCFEVLWAGSYMYLRHLELLENAFGIHNSKAIGPGSFWIRRK